MQQPRHLARIAPIAMLLCTIAGIAGLGGLWPAARTTYANDASPATASISFGNPSALTATVAAGDDFATNVLGDAWDMDKARDLGFEIGYTNIQASNGIWSGTFSGVDQASGGASSGYIFPLFQGFSTPVIPGQLSQELAITKIGSLDRYAIDASKYTQLSYRMSVSPRTNLAVYWTAARPVTWPNSSNYFSQIDGCQGQTQFFSYSGWRVYNFNMAASNGQGGAQAGSWSGTVRGLRIDQSTTTSAAGTQVEIDWIRLSDPNSAEKIVIPWNTDDAVDSDRVDIYYADNPSGTNAAPLVTGLMKSAGSYTLSTSILPPGKHYFQLRLKDGSPQQQLGCTITKATSDWIGPLTITDKPVISFSKPSMTSGPDYASEVLGNPWDMGDSKDIVTPGAPYPETLANKTYNNGVFSAQAVLTPPNTESDSQLWLNVNASKPIDPNRYRYFSVRLKVDMPANKDLHWSISNGWGGRVIWWNTGIQTDGSVSKYGTYYEGWRTYTVDLARAIPAQALGSTAQIDNILHPREENSFPAQQGWTQMSSVSNLRYDPLETMAAAVGSGADVFSIDWVKLTAIDEVKQGNLYSIEGGANVAATSLSSISFYYTTDRKDPTQHSAAAAKLTELQAAPAESTNTIYLPLISSPFQSQPEGYPVSYKWDTAGVTPGTYYICSVASLGTSTATSCSDMPVKVLP